MAKSRPYDGDDRQPHDGAVRRPAGRDRLCDRRRQSVDGNVVLVLVVLIFALLVGLLGLIVRVRDWTRWDLRRLADEQRRLGAQ